MPLGGVPHQGWPEARAGFMTSRQAAGRAPKTLEYFRESLDPLQRFCEHEGLAPGDLTTEALERFCVCLQEGGHGGRGPLAPASVRTRLRAVKTFVRYLQARGLLAPTVTTPIPRVTEPILPTLEPAQVRALLAACGVGHEGRRDRFFIRFLLDSGCRLSEALNLRLRDLDLGAMPATATVLGKARTPRQVMMGRETADLGTQYLQARARLVARAGGGAAECVFLGKCGGPWLPRMAQRRLHWLAQAAGVEPSLCHPHAFRHTFARAFLAKGGDSLVLQRVLGHRDLDMTNRYLRAFGGRDTLERAQAFLPSGSLDADSWTGTCAKPRAKRGRPG